MKLRSLMTSVTLIVLSSPAFSAMQTATLSVENMTCSACPIAVKTALNRVDGVTKIQVSYRHAEAKVTFDDAVTSTEAITQATANAGFPSTLKAIETVREQPL